MWTLLHNNIDGNRNMPSGVFCDVSNPSLSESQLIRWVNHVDDLTASITTQKRTWWSCRTDACPLEFPHRVNALLQSPISAPEKNVDIVHSLFSHYSKLLSFVFISSVFLPLEAPRFCCKRWTWSENPLLDRWFDILLVTEFFFIQRKRTTLLGQNWFARQSLQSLNFILTQS